MRLEYDKYIINIFCIISKPSAYNLFKKSYIFLTI